MFSLRLLGDELGIEIDGEPVAPPAARKARFLLAWLALNPGMQHRSELAPRLWPDVLDASARTSLRTALWQLRRSLGPNGGEYLLTSRERVGLDHQHGIWIDALAFEELARAGRLVEALELCRGELLAGLDDDWVFEARDAHRHRVGQVLAQLAAGAEARDDVDASIDWSRRRLALDPLDEEACRELIRRLAVAGDRPGALAAFAKLRERLRRELGIAASVQTLRLVDSVKAGTLATAAEARDRRPGGAGRLPAPPGLLPLVGREQELGRLGDVWRAVRGGAGAVVTIAGEAGIGKTRLATELLFEARAAGAGTASCAALDLGGAPPLGLWAELLRGLARELGPPPPGARWPRELARLAPDLESWVGLPAGEAPSASPELERTRLFEAMVALVEWAARERPLALLMEDLHLADTTSLELAAYVGRRIAALPLLLVLTRRELPSKPEADALLHALRARNVPTLELELAPLAPEAVRALARAVSRLSAGELERVVELAEGNPLLAVETARALAGGANPVSASLRTTVRASFRALDEDARLLVEAAAVAGRDLDRAEIAALPLERPERAATAAIESGLLVARGAGAGYRHALLREAVYADLAGPRRAWLHERMAEALRGGDRRSPRAAEVARHLRRAGRDDLAVEQLARAAAEARAVGAPDAAAAFLREALEIAPQRPDLLVELAEVEAWRGRRDESEAAFERALEHFGPTDDVAIARAWLRRGRWLRGALCDPGESARSSRRALELVDREPQPDPAARAEALAALAWAEAVAGDPSATDALLEEIEGLQAAIPGGGLLAADVALARGHALLRAGRFSESCGPLVEAGEIAMRAGRPDTAYDGWFNASSAAACAGELERALGFADRCLAALRGRGLITLEAYAQAARAHVLARLGRHEESLAAVEAERELAQRLGDAELHARVAHDRGTVALVSGDFALAERELGCALSADAPVSRPLTRLSRAEALVRLGRLDEAEAELRATALEPVGASDFPDTLVARLTRIQGLVALARGDRELAERRLREAAAGWRRRIRPDAVGHEYMVAIVDLGRPPLVGLTEPHRELERVMAELDEVAGRRSEPAAT